jgi:alkanesulfonate monooxygenase SsuD/methylene tetrahydromethanopterin reductase-like flavin-dependent oxidoreductase (luciferase family)
MELGIHLPLMEFGDEGQSLGRLRNAVEAARDAGFAAVSANDHFVFSTPWLDGPTALASIIEHSGEMTLATTIALVSLRGPVALAKTLAALDLLSEGRMQAGVGPGSSKRDYDAAGVAFDDRWPRFERSVTELRMLLGRDPAPDHTPRLLPRPYQPDGVPLWIGSWGSPAGLRRVARLGDGWLASAYNTTPEQFEAAGELLAAELGKRGRQATGFPNALSTMWTWVTESRAEGDRVLSELLSPLLGREVDDVRERVCVGSAEHCAELLSRYAQAGCGRVYLWPLGDEPRQIELVATKVAARVDF